MPHRQVQAGRDRHSRLQRRVPLPATVKEAAATAGGQPGPNWTLVLRRKPACIIDAQPQGGYTDVYELVCSDCGADPDLEYRDVSAELQQIRGPYPIAAGIAAYQKHDRHHRRRQATHPGESPAARTSS